jgi:Protein of unknown function (DUF2442)/Domain of unknown function (DUF4160)
MRESVRSEAAPSSAITWLQGPPPGLAHFHARYAEHAASVDFDGEIIAGSLPTRALRLVQEWAQLHHTSCSPTGSAPKAKSPCSPSLPSPSMNVMEQLIDVTAVEVLADHRLRLTFEDGTVGDVAFEDREWRGVFEPLADPAYFARVRVDPEAGTIVWPNGVDMAPEPLYAEARRHRVPQPSARG